MSRAALAWCAAFSLAAAIVARLIVPAFPGIFGSVSLNQAAGICNGTLGQLGQAMDHTVAVKCSEVNTIGSVLSLIAAAGIIAAVVFGVLALRHRGES